MDDSPQRMVPVMDGFQVIDRTYSSDDTLPTVGLANIHAVVPGVEENKAKIERAARVFAELGVDVAIFPEFALSGYFWDDEVECRRYMDTALTELHLDWIDEILRPLCRGDLQAIVLNNLTAGPGDNYVNRTVIVSDAVPDLLAPDHSYDKIFLPGIEKTYGAPGADDRFVLQSDRTGMRLGFTTCYDYLFVELVRRYAFEDSVDAIVQLASWRGASSREYPNMNIRTDTYYGQLWDMTMAASSAQNQVWTIACNAVGRHGVSGAEFWGGSGVWAPSGIPLVRASHFSDELLVVRNLDLAGGRRLELDDFNYEFDFREVYRRMDHGTANADSID
ncbi:MAG: carbon-nitrogen hydrolase family protein [Microthrixaceae bacterium]